MAQCNFDNLFVWQCKCGYTAEALLTFAQASANAFFCQLCHERMLMLVEVVDFQKEEESNDRTTEA